MDFVTWIIIFISAVLLYKLFFSGKTIAAPGPKPLPIIGNLHQLNRQHTHFTLEEWYHLYGPVYKFRILSRDYVAISSPDAIHEALVQKSAEFASRPYIFRAQVVNAGQQDIGTHPYTPLLRVLKKEAQKAVKAYGTGLERIEAITMSSVEELIETCAKMGDSQEVDLKQELYRTIINTLCVLIFGRKLSLNDPLVERVIELDHAVAASFSNSPRALLIDAAPFTRYLGNSVMWETLKSTVEICENFWNDFILPHKAEWVMGEERGVADSLFNAQSQVRDQNGNQIISDDNVRLSLQNLVVAGSVTTTNSLYALFNILLHNPSVQRTLQAEIDLVAGARRITLADKSQMHFTRATIFELLRYVTVNPLAIPHVTTTNTSVGGHAIPKDTVCLMNLWAAHHDERIWPDPFKFKPERFLTSEGVLVNPDHPNRKRLFVFGAGVRVCMGETLALNRLFLIVASLLQKFDFLPPEGDHIPCDPRNYTLNVLLNPLPYKVKIRMRNVDYLKHMK